MRSSFSMFLLYHAYVYLEFLILACTIYILAPSDTITDLVKSVTYDAGRQCGSGENERSNSFVSYKEKVCYTICVL